MFDVLHVATMPELENHAAHVWDSATLKKVVALHPPTDWSPVILTFLRQVRARFWRDTSWSAREALEFIGASGGKLTAVPPDELGWLRRDLLEVERSDDFLWLLRWLRQEKNCDPTIYSDLIRTPSMKEKMEALNAGTRYLTPSQRASRARERRRRAEESKLKGGDTQGGK